MKRQYRMPSTPTKSSDAIPIGAYTAQKQHKSASDTWTLSINALYSDFTATLTEYPFLLLFSEYFFNRLKIAGEYIKLVPISARKRSAEYKDTWKKYV